MFLHSNYTIQGLLYICVDRQLCEGGDPGEGVSGVEGVEDEGIMILEDSSDSEDDEDSSEVCVCVCVCVWV